MKRPLLIGLGEVLWDVFPDDSRFGGAPANFACCAAEISDGKCEIAMVSAVGDDALGRIALQELEGHGVDVSAVETMPEHPTGQVTVQLDSQGHASYQFANDVAWDHLPWSDSYGQLAKRADVVCYGTLGQRNLPSQQTISHFLSNTKETCLRLFDVNLRSPFWNPNIILESIKRATAIKLNDDELPIVSNLLNMSGSNEDVMRQILERYSLQFVALTRGVNGSLFLHRNGQSIDLPGEPVNVVDTVGAGDAFTACLAVGFTCTSKSLADVLHWASRVAAYVCTQSGATPKIPSHLRLSAFLE